MAGGETTTQQSKGNEFPWLFTWLTRALGIFTALVMFICGIVTLLPTGIFIGSFGGIGRCLGSGVLMILFSVCMFFIEAPYIAYCSPHLEWIIKLTSYIYTWVRAIIYCGWAIVPILICASISSIIAQMLLFFLGMLYFVLTIGTRGRSVQPPQKARYHSKSGEIDMILKEDMIDSEDEEIGIHSSGGGAS